MLCQNELCHSVAVGGNDTGDDKEQRPKQDIHALEQLCDSGSLPVGEVAEQGLKCGFTAIHQIQIEPGIANTDNAAQHEIDNSHNDGGNGDVDGAANQKCTDIRVQPSAGGENSLARKFKVCMGSGSINVQIYFRAIRSGATQQHGHKAHQHCDHPFAA